ncbi:Hypothetical predicted protein, partial [Pelobates cultripes]
MTTSPIIQSAEKRKVPMKNKAKHHPGAPGFVKASDGTIIPREDLKRYEGFLDSRKEMNSKNAGRSNYQEPSYSSYQPAKV